MSISSAQSVATSQKSSMPSKLFGLGSGLKPQISIQLDEPRSSYSTLDKISGKVTIVASQNTRFEKISIQFIGASKTFIEKLHTAPGMAASQSAFHNFLRLTQPISEASYPQPRILEAGRVYEFPFLFVVPQQLLPRVCRHTVQHDSVRDLHLQLPPSLGGQGDHEGWEGPFDDFAPLMANINYSIVAQLQDEDKRAISLKSKAIDILPRFDEHPPVNTEGPDSDYRLRKEKSIKKGLFKGRLGSLVIETDQPKSLQLPADYRQSSTPVSTAVKLRLRFDPVSDGVLPPKLCNLSNRLKISSWYSDTARTIVPNKKSIQYDMHQGLHSETITLSSRSMENVEWILQKADADPKPTLSRRDSALSSCSTSSTSFPLPSEKYDGGEFYTAEILVPITLPTNKYFVPTFHSCLISRAYGLHFSLSLQGGGITAPSIDLKVPVQVSAKGRDNSETSLERTALTVAEQVEEARIADEFFVPRTVSPLEQSLVGNSRLAGLAASDLTSAVPSDLPPQYEVSRLGGRNVRMVV